MPTPTLRIQHENRDRYDTGLDRAPGGFVSGTARRFTRWLIEPATAPGAARVRMAATVDAPDDLPGPVRTLEPGERFAWGPTIIEEGLARGPAGPLVAAALADAGGRAALPWFRLVAGAVHDDGVIVALALERRGDRTGPSHVQPVPGPPVRIALLDRNEGRLLRVVDDAPRAPTAIAWAGDALLLGAVDHLDVVGLDATTELDLVDTTAARSVAVAPDGRVAAGTASGRVVVFAGPLGPTVDGWAAHEVPILAMAWSAGGSASRLATGGYEGWVRIWADGSPAGEINVRQQVDAIAWLDEDRLVVKAGGQRGRILLVAGAAG